MTRLDRLVTALDEPLLVSSSANVRYLTGLHSSNAALLIAPGGAATLFADFRYADAASAIPDVEFVEVGRDLLGELGRRLAGQRFAFEAAHVSYAGWGKLAAGGADLVPALGMVESLREVKEPAEIDAIRAAATLSDRVFEELAGERFVGRTESALAWWIESRFRELGADGVSFAVIVATGANGARPHAVPGSTTIEKGTFVVVDAGCVVDGYCSDCTRTFSTGDVPDELSEAYAVCLTAQLNALDAIAPGVAGRDADAASRVAVDAAGLGAAYGHGLGHGVGMEVHEGPVLRPESTDTLHPWNVVTVEPGIYLKGLGGVRIEDLVVVTDDGCERLTTVAKELTIVE